MNDYYTIVFDECQTDFADKIDAGVKFLDTKVPGWVDEIDLDRLDLYSQDNCVLGQLGRKHFPCEARWRNGYQACIGKWSLWSDTHNYGFNTVTLTQFKALTAQWHERIEKLRAERSVLV